MADSTDAADPVVAAYEIAKLQAATDGAFDEKLLRHWFEAAWDLCAAMVGLVFPPLPVDEMVTVAPDGAILLSAPPAGDVRFFSGPNLVAVLPPNSPCFGPRPGGLFDDESGVGLRCPDLCCFCNVRAIYTTDGGLGIECDEVPPWFVQAVARLFVYIAENRGDTEMDERVLAKCGAKAFLAPYLTYAL